MIGKTMSSDLIEQIELNIEDGKKLVKQGDALRRLSKNADFVTIIREGYFKDESVRLVQAKASPSMATPEKQAALIKSIDAIGELFQYFHMTEVQAQMAREAITSDEETLEELSAEEGEG